MAQCPMTDVTNVSVQSHQPCHALVALGSISFVMVTMFQDLGLHVLALQMGPAIWICVMTDG